jgi:tetratricopeptide (TPR) repeat protein
MNLGRYDAAWESLQQEVADATHPFGSAFKEFGTGVFLAELMAYERASEVFGDVVRRMEQLRRPWAQMWAQAALAQSLSRTASTDEETLHRVAQDLEGLSAPDSIAKGGIPSSALGEIALYLGGADEALRQADVACARTAESSYRTAYIPAVELRLRALLELDRPQDVVEQANATIEMADAMGYRPMLWRLRATKARALEMLGEAEAAKREYTAVAEIIQKLADTIPDPGLRRGFLADMVVSSLMSGSSIGLN